MTKPSARELAAELHVLHIKLNARRDQPGYAENCRAIEARIAEIEALQRPKAKRAKPPTDHGADDVEG